MCLWEGARIQKSVTVPVREESQGQHAHRAVPWQEGHSRGDARVFLGAREEC